jgi:hypothetical protein
MTTNIEINLEVDGSGFSIESGDCPIIGIEMISGTSISLYTTISNVEPNDYTTSFDDEQTMLKADMEEMKRPIMKPSRIIMDGRTKFCPECMSSMKFTLNPFNKNPGCIQPQCTNYYGNKK